MTDNTSSIALIGLGPRGISVLERLVAQLNTVSHPPEKLTLHLIDDAQHGGGKIWDINQPKYLCMNTFAHGMTLFSETNSTVEAPVVEGPTIYEWIRLTLGDAHVSPGARDYVAAHPLDPQVLGEFGRTELEKLRPESYLPRALYGHYILWVFHSVLQDVPEWVEVKQHHARVVDIESREGADILHLNNDTTVAAGSTLAVTGWQNQGYTENERWILKTLEDNPSLRWIRADNPIDQGVDSIKDNEKVLVRGLGMGFFDILILSTVGRGGKFVEDSSKPWGMRYEATGTEPTFAAASRRGYPFLPQSNEGALPPAAEIPRLKKVVAELSHRTGARSINYDTEVWPAVARDAYQAYIDTLARVEPESLRASREEIIAALDATPVDAGVAYNGLAQLDEVIARHTTKDFSLLRWMHLLTEDFSNQQELTEHIAQSLCEDLAESQKGPDSPVRAALWSVGFSRKPTQVLGAEGRYTLESRHHMFDKAISLGQTTCSGPPPFRTQQLLALVDAGIVSFVGGNPVLGTNADAGEWTISSSASGGKRIPGTTLLDAWVHKPDIRRTPHDSFMHSLVESGRVRAFTETASDGIEVPTGSPAEDPDTRQVHNADGTVDERLHLVGIPAHAEYPDTTLAPPIPGTDSWFIQEADKAAVHAAQVALAGQA
ncbi:FAD/NAD(P)-binding protein [Corynebacterium sp. KPL3739]|uniref:FAD/NAD(P)-binding protein n=1 Tax=Corynebacterium sp. KPL3739 TaxID=3158321 RepID=UPI0032EDA99E